MSNTVKENLAKQVLETQEGITPEQLKSLIEEGATTPDPTNQVPVEPASAPAPQAPAATPAPAPAPTPAPTEPAPGQPNVLDLIPEKFRAKDVPTSLSNITKSYSELEAELKKQKDETANLNKVVQSFMEKEPTYTPPEYPVNQPQGGHAPDVDDATFFERPTESAKKVAAQIATAAVMAYHIQQERQKYVNNFKATHPDFANYQDDIMAILKTRPDLDGNEQNLPLVYEMAKQRYATRLSAMRSELGLVKSESAPEQGTPASQINIDEITRNAYLKARDDILAEVERRRQASGLQGAGAAGGPDSRVQPRVKEKELSPDDILMQEMLNAGPKKLNLLMQNE